MKPRAWLYARFSSSQQQDGDSINRQVNAAQQWCMTNGVELQKTSFRDLAVSGWKSIKRPMFEQLIKAMAEGKIPRGSYVLFESTDRLSRRGWWHTQQLIRMGSICLVLVGQKQRSYLRNRATPRSYEGMAKLNTRSIGTLSRALFQSHIGGNVYT